MRIFVLGADSQLGQRFTQFALTEGHSVTAFVSHGSAWPHPPHIQLRVARGDLLNRPTLAHQMLQHDVVVATLDADAMSSVEPFYLFSDACRVACSAMQMAQLNRLLWVANAGILDLPAGKGYRMQAQSLPAKQRIICEDHFRVYEVLSTSAIDWQVFCPPHLERGMRTRRYRLRANMLPDGGAALSVEDLADALLKNIQEPQFVHHRVGIAY